MERLGGTWLGLWMLLGGGALAGTAPVKAAGPAVVVPSDGEMDAADALIGRALFLRGFPMADVLSYDTAGVATGSPKIGDWTLAAIDIKKAERHGTKEIEIDGVRVAIRYNSDNHQFERHPQPSETIKVRVADAGSIGGFAEALHAIFAQGIDLRLQQATPAYWQHFFNPSLPWPADALTGQQIYVLNGTPEQAKDITPPAVMHKTEAHLTSFALQDKVRGTVLLRLVVDADGAPQRISIARPSGYGLDQLAAESLAKWHFSPAIRQGKAVAASVQLSYDFEIAPGH